MTCRGYLVTLEGTRVELLFDEKDHIDLSKHPNLARNIRLAQSIMIVLHGHDEAPHPIVPTLTRDEITADDVRDVEKFISARAVDEDLARKLEQVKRRAAELGLDLTVTEEKP